MLVKFAVKNYRGFANKIEWDLSKPSNYSFNTFAVKDGVIKMVSSMGRMDQESLILPSPSLTLPITFLKSGRR